MTMRFALMAATLFAGTAVAAQTTGSTTTPDSTMSGGQMGPSSTTTDPGMSSTGAGAPAMAPNAADGMMQKDGKWMMGDRPATKAEIAAHKKAMKKPG